LFRGEQGGWTGPGCGSCGAGQGARRPGWHLIVRTQDGWITVPWTHLPMISAPFAEFTWQYARRMAAEKGTDDTNETEVARVLDDLLTRAQAGPADKRAGRVAARTRAGAAAHRLPPREDHDAGSPPGGEGADQDQASEKLATVIPFGIFDADTEASRW
jgi:hypothetical protein